jgi:Secretion system C-terminal sorting domain
MKKTTKLNFAKKLAKYGALSLAVAGVADVTGQVVYTDIDPDFVGGLGDMLFIDFDNNAVDDLTILQSNNGNYELVQANTSNSNGVVANSNGYLYASNLAYGTSIDGFLTFYSGGASFCAGVGYAGSAFCGVGEGYLGVQFHIGGNLHFGWVRVDILDSSNFIVLDYAYEATPDTTILAGNILSVEDFDPSNFKYFVDVNSQLNIKASVPMTNVTIHNVLGQQVVSQKLSNTQATIDMSSFDSGLYLATVEINGTRKTFKIVRK